MNTNNQSDIRLPLSHPISPADDDAVMPGEFAGMYQAGFEAGYSKGKEAGHQQGFAEGYAAVHQGPNGAAFGPGAQKAHASVGPKTAIEGKPAPKHGPRRMLLGMPCRVCRVYLMNDETHCPCCKQPVAA